MDRQRHRQVAKLLAERIAEAILPALGSELKLVSITRLELTRDMKDGTVWATAAPDVPHDRVVDRMSAAIRQARSQLRRSLDLRYFPNLVVRYDEGQAESLSIERLLDSV